MKFWNENFDTDERKPRLSVGHLHVTVPSICFDCLQWREIDFRSLDLSKYRMLSFSSREITINLLAVMSVHWNEKV